MRRVALLVAAALAGCGGGEARTHVSSLSCGEVSASARHEIGDTEGDMRRDTRCVQETGRLVVRKSLPAGPVYTEGSVTRLRIARVGGLVAVDGLRPVDTVDVPLFDGRLPAGRYEVRTVERPCEGSCGLLDPPDEATRCRLEVAVRPGATTRVEVVVALGAAECTVG